MIEVIFVKPGPVVLRLPAGRQGFLNKIVTLYVIRSEVNSELYVGITMNLENRLQEHTSGKNRYTKGLRPWKLVYSEEYANWSDRRKQEKYYKPGSGKEKLKLNWSCSTTDSMQVSET